MSDVMEVELLRCSLCKGVFAICVPCFRGQGYCSPSCKDAGARAVRRAANSRHQRSDAGCLDHRDRMRALRERRSVTDAGSTKLACPVDCALPVPVISPRSINVSFIRPFVLDSREAVSFLRCRICGVLGTHVVRRRSRAPP